MVIETNSAANPKSIIELEYDYLLSWHLLDFLVNDNDFSLTSFDSSFEILKG